MTLTLETLAFLTTPEGERLLAELAHEDLSDAHTLRLLTRLRRSFSGERAGAALELAQLRAAAVAKFGAAAARMFFTRDALQQASHPLVRAWRQQERQPTASKLLDVCSSIGSDALAFAAAGSDTLGIDIDPLRVEMARLNAAALGLSARFEVADAREYTPEADQHIFYDPARRDESGARIFSVERYEPPLSLVNRWQMGRVIDVKLSPGVALAELAPYSGRGWSLRFISVHGDLKEAALRYDAGLGDRQPPGAVMLTDEHSYTMEHRRDHDFPDAAPREPRAWLCEPDPAAIRAGLVQQVAHDCGGSLLDETIAYFTTDHGPVTPWVQAWQIESWLPFSVKRLREMLRAGGVGRVTVKKRGTAVTPDALIPQLKLKGDAERVVVLTRLRGQPIALVCLVH
jgi:SAM-dependent methyltransferase